ncbi:MAG: glycosyltransferase family 4 protein [Actinobacteria bacterium]|nr:glycosyltransferase family 4 protein [Actinomycetota bacterium]
MRILVWHGWLLEGSGSNVYTARTVEVWRRAGHEVLLMAQERHPERYPFLDSWGTVDGEAVQLEEERAGGAAGRGVLLRPAIGDLLPVFVYDDYEGFRVKTFVDLEDRELAEYLERNVAALRTAAEWFGPDLVVAGHAVPGPVVARRALGDGRYVAKIHGSDLEYAIREQSRYVDLASEGLEGARAVAGATRDVLARTVSFVPTVADRIRVVAPGVEVERFRPRPRREALLRAAERLDGFPGETALGRPVELEGEVREALARRDAAALEALAGRYDQAAPDPDAAARLRALAERDEPLVGYIGKLIPQKGVDLLVQALGAVRTTGPRPRGLVIGFGTFREWLAALVAALDSVDAEGLAWLAGSSGIRAELAVDDLERCRGLARRVDLTGRLDHRFAPATLAALDVIAVPSVLEEAFGMVAAEGASAGALPLVARHSGLAEIAEALEGEVDRPGLFSFEPGPGATGRLAHGIERLLSLAADERADLQAAISAFVAREWTWERTAEHLLEAWASH